MLDTSDTTAPNGSDATSPPPVADGVDGCPSNAMTSSEERTSAEAGGSRLPHRGVRGGLLRPPVLSGSLGTILGRKGFLLRSDRLAGMAPRH